jgi:Flp pilus assembly protein TadG
MRNLILGLARPLLRLLGSDERGAIGVLIGLLFGGGVLIGMGALVIDVGQLYQERAELQSGADAASLAVAKSCAAGTCTPGAAATYANANAKDGLSSVSQVCGSGTLGSCPASTGTMTDCPAAPAIGTNYVDVHTSTAESGGGTLLPPVFASTLLGNSSYQGSTVYACSQAQWGGPSVAKVTAVTISACEWDQATSLGTVYAPPPPSRPSSSLDRVIQLRSTSGGGCPGEAGGADAPGLFGWTADPASTCSLAVSVATYAGAAGASVSPACKAVLAAHQASRAPIFIAVYTSVSGSGAGAVYALKGFAAFVVTGYYLPGFFASDWLAPASNCSGLRNCLNGYFTQAIIPNTSSVGGTYLGATVLALTG